MSDGPTEPRRRVGLDGRRGPGRPASRTASASSPIEAKRVREFGFGAAELERAKKWMAAFYERAYTERDKTESGSFAQEYLNYFLDDEPSPGIEYEYRLVQQLLPDDHGRRSRRRLAQAPARRRQPRDARRLAAEGGHRGPDRSRAARRARRRPSARPVTAWADRRRRPSADGERSRTPGSGRLAPRRSRARRHHRPLRERRRGVAEADRLQERPDPVHDGGAGRFVARAAGRFRRGLAGDVVRRASRASAA